MSVPVVTIPWGADLALVLNAATPFVVAGVSAGVAWACRKIPGAYVAGVKENLTEAKISRAVQYAFAKVEGATQGGSVTVDHTNALVETAMAYGQALFPDLVKTLEARFEPMLLAKISALSNVESSAGVAPLPRPPETSFIKVPT